MKSQSRAKGGGIGAIPEGKPPPFSTASSPVVKEAEKRKRGGKVGKMPMHVEGSMPKRMRLDRRGRKSGGSVGADSRPMTEASKLNGPEGGGSE